MIIPEGSPRQHSEIARPERRGASKSPVIEDAKLKVPVIDLADRLVAEAGGGWRKSGREWYANCPLPGHPGGRDRTPSLAVNTEKNSWWCHSCLVGGDVLELARYAWKFEKSEVAMAAGYLLLEFGHDVPKRPASYFRKQDRQARARQALEDAKIQRFTRRLYRAFVAPGLAEYPDGPELDDEEERGWRDCELAAKLLVYQDRGGRA